jgi:hypothetical protein
MSETSVKQALGNAIEALPQVLVERAVRDAQSTGRKPYALSYGLVVSDDLVKRVDTALLCLEEAKTKKRERDALQKEHKLPEKFEKNGVWIHHSTHGARDGDEETWMVYAKKAESFLWNVFVRYGKDGWLVELCPQAELTPSLSERERGRLKIVLDEHGEVVR